MKKPLILFLVIAPLFGLSLAAGQVYYLMNFWKYKGETTEFVIQAGEPFSRINYRLHKDGFISNPKIFHHYAKYKDILTSFKSGTYVVPSGVNMLQLIDLLLSGKTVTESVTIPEGKNFYEVADILEARGIIADKKELIALAKDPNFASEMGIPAETIEGYLYPETYFFSPNTPTKEVAKVMIRQFFKQVENIDLTNSPFKTLHELVILASMVEKETGAAFERPMIAAVFLNRLKKKMRLQSDPTTIYGIWETWNGNLRKRHLEEATPYNTYRIPALPKGPIANPSLLSIQAILNPDKNDYIYFVSKNDGTHVFSKTYKEHREAVDFWQKRPENRKGRSWRDLNKRREEQTN